MSKREIADKIYRTMVTKCLAKKPDMNLRNDIMHKIWNSIYETICTDGEEAAWTYVGSVETVLGLA